VKKSKSTMRVKRTGKRAEEKGKAEEDRGEAADAAVICEDGGEFTESPSKRRRVDVGGKFVSAGTREGAPARGRLVRARLPAPRSSAPAPKVVPAKRPATATALPRSRPATSSPASKSNIRPSASTSRSTPQTKVPTPRITRSTSRRHAPSKASTYGSRDTND